MEAMDLVQARTPKKVKNTANDILDQLGLNMSTYINMSLKQLILQGGIPFSVKVSPHVYNAEKAISEVDATLSFEEMPLTAEDKELLRQIKHGNLTTDEARRSIMNEV